MLYFSLTTLKITAIAIALITAGCSTRKRQIEITNPKPSTTPNIAKEPEWRPSDEGTASVVTEIPESELVKYMDRNAKLEFKFSYAGVEKAGDITFADEKARIEISGLPINQTSTMVMQLFENGVMKLEGRKDNVTLKAGPNSESLSLKVVPPTKPDTPEDKPDTPDIKPDDKPDTPEDKPDTPDDTPDTPDTQPETAELVLSLEFE